MFGHETIAGDHRDDAVFNEGSSYITVVSPIPFSHPAAMKKEEHRRILQTALGEIEIQFLFGVFSVREI